MKLLYSLIIALLLVGSAISGPMTILGAGVPSVSAPLGVSFISTNSGSNSANSTNITLPTGASAGDELVIVSFGLGGGSTATMSGGSGGTWTATSVNAGGGNCSINVKVLTGADISGTLTLTQAGAFINEKSYLYRGGAGTITLQTTATSTTSPVTSTGFTKASSSSAIISTACSNWNISNTLSNTSSFIDRGQGVWVAAKSTVNAADLVSGYTNGSSISWSFDATFSAAAIINVDIS